MSHRIERLNSEMQKCIADIIRNKVSDPRISGMVSVLDVNVTKDLKYAKVRVSVYDDKPEDVLNALNKSAGFIRTEVAAQFRDIRCIPQLTFVLDTSLEYAQHISKILDTIKTTDENKDE